MMKDVDMDILVAAVAFIVFFAMMFGAMMYSDSKKTECKVTALQRGMTAIEIQAVCNR